MHYALVLIFGGKVRASYVFTILLSGQFLFVKNKYLYVFFKTERILRQIENLIEDALFSSRRVLGQALSFHCHFKSFKIYSKLGIKDLPLEDTIINDHVFIDNGHAFIVQLSLDLHS